MILIGNHSWRKAELTDTYIQAPVFNRFHHIAHAFGTAQDKPEDPQHKYHQISQAAGLGTWFICNVKQVHKSDVLHTKEASQYNEVEADAMVTSTAGLLLCIRTADCTPILLCDPKVPVVAAIHAGWRSAYSGIIANTIEQMEKLGAVRSRIIAAIGPTIRQNNYEVDSVFHKHFTECYDYSAAFFIHARPGHYFFDLPAFCSSQLRQFGLTEVHDTGFDTYSDQRFYSYRQLTALEKSALILTHISAIGIYSK